MQAHTDNDSPLSSDLTSVSSIETPRHCRRDSVPRATHPRCRPKPKPAKFGPRKPQTEKGWLKRQSKTSKHAARRADSNRARYRPLYKSIARRQRESSQPSTSSDELPTQATQDPSVVEDPNEHKLADTSSAPTIKSESETEDQAPIALRERIRWLEKKLISAEEAIELKSSLIRKMFEIDKQNGTRTGDIGLRWLARQRRRGRL